MVVVKRLWAAVAGVLLLLAPALWNGFPFLQYDTGGYLARWFEGYLVPSRSVVYGLFLTAGWPLDFWPIVVGQAALTVWVLALVLRAHGIGGRPFVLIGIIALLSTTTTLPWIVGILLTDIFAGLSVLAIHLLVWRADGLHRWERIALVALGGFSVATHSATFLVVLALGIAALIASLCDRTWVPRAGVARAAFTIMLGVTLVFAANYAVAKRFAWIPGGYGIVFARMLQDGIVSRYLDDHCPDPGLKLCACRSELPRDADAFLWGQGVFDKLGRFSGLGEEMRRIVLDSLIEYPRLQAQMALRAAIRQLVTVASGEGVLATIWHTYGIIERFTPTVLPAMRAAHQQRGELNFRLINVVHVPIALATMSLIPAVILLGWRRREFGDLGLLAATTALALLANAFVCGALSNPHDRYGARLAWVAPFVVTLVPLRRYSAAISHGPNEGTLATIKPRTIASA